MKEDSVAYKMVAAQCSLGRLHCSQLSFTLHCVLFVAIKSVLSKSLFKKLS